MPITINGSGTLTGISAGGLPDDCITTADIAAGAVTTAKITGGPAFRAYATSATTLSPNTATRILFQTEEFDTANCFASSRFTPNVAGYYSVSSTVRADIANQTALHIYFYKNGISYAAGTFFNVTTAQASSHCTALVYLNGTTDYVESHCYSSVTGSTFTGEAQTWFTGFLARPA